jgi:hypothetical protein
MSRGQPLKSTNRARAAHTEADHLEKTIAALHVYLSAIIAETAQDIPASTLDRRYLDGLFQQFSADVLGAIRDAAAEMRVRENWKASW